VPLALFVVVGSAGASGGFRECGKRPARLEWNIEAKGVGCQQAIKLAHGSAQGQGLKRVGKHLFRYHSGDWTCTYTVFHSTKAQDSEGEIFDCRKAPDDIVRWSDSPEIQPHALA
jgi:hypothetical protein